MLCVMPRERFFYNLNYITKYIIEPTLIPPIDMPSLKSLRKGKSIENSNLMEYPSKLEKLNRWSRLDIALKKTYHVGFLD